MQIGYVRQLALHLERQRDGVARAKAAGKYKGGPTIAMNRTTEVLELHAQGVTVAEIFKRVPISRASVYRILRASARGAIVDAG